MTLITFWFRRNTATRRFGHLSRLLNTIHSEISGEISKLRASGDNITTCAAFAFEAQENAQDIAPTIDKLERDLVDNLRRAQMLEEQEIFIAGMQSRLDAFLSHHRISGQADINLRQ